MSGNLVWLSPVPQQGPTEQPRVVTPEPAVQKQVQTAQAQVGSQISQILATIKHFESGGNYTAKNPNGSASGAYQFIDATWGGYGGYAHAYQAPPAVQDAKATAMVKSILAAHNGDVNWVPAVWFAGPYGATHTNWNTIPGPPGWNGSTIQQYHDKWMGYYNTTSKAPAKPAPAKPATPAKVEPPEPAPMYSPMDHQAVTQYGIFNPLTTATPFKFGSTI